MLDTRGAIKTLDLNHDLLRALESDGLNVSPTNSYAPSLASIDEETEELFEDSSCPHFELERMSSEFFCGMLSLPPVVDDTPPRPCIKKEPQEEEDSMDSSSSSSSSSQRRRQQVRFGSVSIRSYDVTVGDNVPTRGGIPVAMDWSYLQQPTIELDDYEDMRPCLHKKPPAFRMSRRKRKEILTKAGFRAKELRKAQKTALKSRYQRKLSNAWHPAETVLHKLALVV